MNTLLEVARRNIRQFIANATFKSEADRWSAGQCIDVMEAALADGRGEGVEADCERARVVGWWNCPCAKCREHAARNNLSTQSPEPPTAADDQEWDRQAEALQVAAFGPGTGINPDATDITNLFMSDSPTTTDAGREDEWMVVEAWIHDGRTAELKLQRRYTGTDESTVLDLSCATVRLTPAGGEDGRLFRRQLELAPEAVAQPSIDWQEEYSDWYEGARAMLRDAAIAAQAESGEGL